MRKAPLKGFNIMIIMIIIVFVSGVVPFSSGGVLW